MVDRENMEDDYLDDDSQSKPDDDLSAFDNPLIEDD